MTRLTDLASLVCRTRGTANMKPIMHPRPAAANDSATATARTLEDESYTKTTMRSMIARPTAQATTQPTNPLPPRPEYWESKLAESSVPGVTVDGGDSDVLCTMSLESRSSRPPSEAVGTV